jgi:hypothetical protein
MFRRFRPSQNHTVDNSAEPRELDSSELAKGPTSIPVGARGRSEGGYPRVIPAGEPFVVAGEYHRQELPKQMELPARPMNSAQYLQIPGGATGELLMDGVAFPIRTIQVDNYTSCWLLVSSAERYIPPLTMGWQFPCARASSQIRVVGLSPPGIAQPAFTPLGVFSVFVFEGFMTMQAGGVA